MNRLKNTEKTRGRIICAGCGKKINKTVHQRDIMDMTPYCSQGCADGSGSWWGFIIAMSVVLAFYVSIAIYGSSLN